MVASTRLIARTTEPTTRTGDPPWRKNLAPYLERPMRPANVQAGCSVLVTGATGFTGGALARRLLREGHRVRLLVRSPRKAAHLEALGAEIVVGDICRAHDVTAATEGCQTVYHLAALYRSAKFPPDMYRRVNVEGTRNVLDAGRTCRVQRLVHCSTVGVHGEVKTIPADETAPIVPHDAYQRSKAEGERLAREAAESGLPVVIFRPCGIYGPGDLRFLKLFRMVLSRVRMVGTGNVYYHLTHINALVNGILLCGRHPAAVGQTYLLAGPRYTTIDELVPLLAKAAGVPEPRLRLPLWPFKAAAWACQTIAGPCASSRRSTPAAWTSSA